MANPSQLPPLSLSQPCFFPAKPGRIAFQRRFSLSPQACSRLNPGFRIPMLLTAFPQSYSAAIPGDRMTHDSTFQVVV